MARDEFQDLFSIYAPLAAAVFAVILLAYIVVIVRFRRRRGEQREPPQPSDRWRWEVAYAAVLAAIAVTLIVVTLRATDRVDALAADPGLTVDVTAFKWQWAFDYGDGVEIVGAEPSGLDEAEFPTMAVPTGTTIRVRLRSNDVVHSFWVPYARFKRDAFPKRTTEFDLRFDEPGRHEGICAEFCGLDHTIMRFTVEALEPAAFQRWLDDRRAAS